MYTVLSLFFGILDHIVFVAFGRCCCRGRFLVRAPVHVRVFVLVHVRVCCCC